MKHKHAEFIHAWADGKTIQMSIDGRTWIDITSPKWAWDTHEQVEYRIKPAKPFMDIPLYNGYILRFHQSDTGWMCGISNEMMDAIEEVYK